MNKINDFSRRFLADFIAVRLRAMRIEKEAIRRITPGAETSPRVGEDPARTPKSANTRPGEIPPIEHDSRFRPGLGSSH